MRFIRESCIALAPSATYKVLSASRHDPLPREKHGEGNSDSQQRPASQGASHECRESRDQPGIAPRQARQAGVRVERERYDDCGQHRYRDKIQRGAHKRRERQPVAKHEDGRTDRERDDRHAQDEQEVVHLASRVRAESLSIYDSTTMPATTPPATAASKPSL